MKINVTPTCSIATSPQSAKSILGQRLYLLYVLPPPCCLRLQEEPKKLVLRFQREKNRKKKRVTSKERKKKTAATSCWKTYRKVQHILNYETQTCNTYPIIPPPLTISRATQIPLHPLHQQSRLVCVAPSDSLSQFPNLRPHNLP